MGGSGDIESDRATPSLGPIVQYWDAKPPPGYMAYLLRTFGDLNPAMRHLVFSAPEADEFIAERFTSREVAAFRACTVPAMQADYFRYCAVLALGGIYSDADCRCVANLMPLIPPVLRSDRGLRSGESRV